MGLEEIWNKLKELKAKRQQEIAELPDDETRDKHLRSLKLRTEVFGMKKEVKKKVNHLKKKVNIMENHNMMMASHSILKQGKPKKAKPQSGFLGKHNL